MLGTKACRVLIGEWNPPSKVEQDESDASEDQAEFIYSDEEQTTVKIKSVRHHCDINGTTAAIRSGITYQPCGGGRRIIRKQIEGS